MTEPQIQNMRITWHSEDQRDIFASPKRFNVVRAGRRWGKTKGAFHKLSDLCVSLKTKHLWVDTTQANIEKYFDEHLAPLLPKAIYHWDKRKKVLTFHNGSIVHFGSAQIPENLEGFGYQYIWLNEAGLILRGEAGRRLWANTIRPMAMEHKARCWFVGTPKGEGLFKEFIERGQSDDPKWADWAEFHRASFDRDGITQEEIDDLISETPGGVESQVYRQEILAEVLEHDEGEPIVSYAHARAAVDREFKLDSLFKPIWGVDPSGEGDDEAGLCKRLHNRLVEPTKTKTGKLDGEIGAAWIKEEYDRTPDDLLPHEILIDGIGEGSGWYTHMRAMSLPVRKIIWSNSAMDKEKYFQRRDELWVTAAKWVETGSLSGDYELMREITKPLLDINFLEAKGKYKVEAKDKMRRRLKREGSSPNRADAFVLTFSCGTERKRRMSKSISSWQRQNSKQGGVPWMAM